MQKYVPGCKACGPQGIKCGPCSNIPMKLFHTTTQTNHPWTREDFFYSPSNVALQLGPGFYTEDYFYFANGFRGRYIGALVCSASAYLLSWYNRQADDFGNPTSAWNSGSSVGSFIFNASNPTNTCSPFSLQKQTNSFGWTQNSGTHTFVGNDPLP